MRFLKYQGWHVNLFMESKFTVHYEEKPSMIVTSLCICHRDN